MGQYYKAFVAGFKDEPVCVESWSYDSGAKLMEHSWIGNEFVNAVMYLIGEYPRQIAWVGDYSDDVGCPDDVYDFCWHDATEDGEPAHLVKPEPPRNYLWDGEHNDFIRNGTVGYFINHTKREYVDLNKYIANNKSTDPDWGGLVHPLPLLTSIGNGQGGGDYHSGRAFEHVGEWFMDEIEYTTHFKPHGCRDITMDVLFKEAR